VIVVRTVVVYVVVVVEMDGAVVKLGKVTVVFASDVAQIVVVSATVISLYQIVEDGTSVVCSEVRVLVVVLEML
jgi:hypothetical protein